MHELEVPPGTYPVVATVFQTTYGGERTAWVTITLKEGVVAKRESAIALNEDQATVGEGILTVGVEAGRIMALIPSGNGDGAYPVLADYAADGSVLRYFVDFMILTSSPRRFSTS